MPLKKEVIDGLSKLGIDAAKLIVAANADTEQDFPLPEGSIYKDVDIATLKDNVKKGHETAYVEIYGKQVNEELQLGLSVTDAKDPKKVHAAIANKAILDAKIEPDKKVKELQESLRKLQEEVIPAEKKVADEWKNKYTERAEYDQYASHVPPNANKFLTQAEHVARVKAAVLVGEKGIAIDPTTGESYKDKLQNPVLFKDKVAELYKSNENWIEPEGAQTKRFHHSTNGNAKGKAGDFDYDKALETVSAKYDMNSLDGREAAQNELTTMQTNHHTAAA